MKIAALLHPEPVQRARLELMRDSTFNVASTAAMHIELAIGCLRVDDDVALAHHVGRAVNAMRALAKLTNEITEIKNGIAP